MLDFGRCVPRLRFVLIAAPIFPAPRNRLGDLSIYQPAVQCSVVRSSYPDLHYHTADSWSKISKGEDCSTFTNMSKVLAPLTWDYDIGHQWHRIKNGCFNYA